VLADKDGPFLDRFDSVKLVASTVPVNGDINPYGIVVVPRSVGSLKRGHILISNFNNSTNAQGIGTTIVQVSPEGTLTLFAQIDPSTVAGRCPGGVGLTTALTVLRRGWVIVGSLPTTNGMSATAEAGCLIVLDSAGQVVETFHGGGINGPWDMTSLDAEDQAWLFVTNVLNGDVTVAPAHEVDQGTVLRIALEVPEQGEGLPALVTTTTIGSGFAETADPNALVIGPTGVGLGEDGTLYVADTLSNRIAAIPQALTRQTTALTGFEVSFAGALNGPLGLAIAPNGHIITANAGDGNLVETTPAGSQVAVKTVETATGAGSLFGIAIVPGRRGVYFVDDGDNTVKVFESKATPEGGDDGDD
jgi:sugar lactone lactonase YvrE